MPPPAFSKFRKIRKKRAALPPEERRIHFQNRHLTPVGDCLQESNSIETAGRMVTAQNINTRFTPDDLKYIADQFGLKRLSFVSCHKRMINAPSRGRVIDISVAGLMTSVQEIVLSFRHGEKDEDLINHRAQPSDVYRLLEVNLQPNEQRRAAVIFQYKALFSDWCRNGILNTGAASTGLFI
jgi:hypothetical protein